VWVCSPSEDYVQHIRSYQARLNLLPLWMVTLDGLDEDEDEGSVCCCQSYWLLAESVGCLEMMLKHEEVTVSQDQHRETRSNQ
jgi:hypothetical protein